MELTADLNPKLVPRKKTDVISKVCLGQRNERQVRSALFKKMTWLVRTLSTKIYPSAVVLSDHDRNTDQFKKTEKHNGGEKLKIY